jgi:peroxiredoxin Q/BCP
MRKISALMLVLALAVPVLAQQLAAPAATSPKVGEMAPDFVVKPGGRGGAAVNLKDYQGKQNVLIEFFPGAFTPGCTQEFTDNGKEFEKYTALNVAILGISADLPGAQTQFKTSVGAKNDFVSDRDLTIATKYGAQNPTSPQPMKRFYFLIDQTGKIVWADTSNRLILTDQLRPLVTTALKK